MSETQAMLYKSGLFSIQVPLSATGLTPASPLEANPPLSFIAALKQYVSRKCTAVSTYDHNGTYNQMNFLIPLAADLLDFLLKARDERPVVAYQSPALPHRSPHSPGLCYCALYRACLHTAYAQTSCARIPQSTECLNNCTSPGLTLLSYTCCSY